MTKYIIGLLLAVLGAAPTLSAQQVTPTDSIAPEQQMLGPMMDAAPMIPGWQPRPMPQNAWQVSPEDFGRLLQAVNSQTFASNQLPMVQAAGLCGWFTCSQCAALMNIFDFDDNRLKVVEYLAPHIIDPIRCQPIMDQLSFQDSRQKAWRILSEASL